PSSNYAGPDSFTYRVKDSSGTYSAPVTVTINVNPINDPPEFFLLTSRVTGSEDSGPRSVPLATLIAAGPSTATDEADQELNFVVTPTGTTGGLTFSKTPEVSPDGTLTYTPAAN